MVIGDSVECGTSLKYIPPNTLSNQGIPLVKDLNQWNPWITVLYKFLRTEFLAITSYMGTVGRHLF